MKRTLSAVLIVVGMAIGFTAAHLAPQSAVSAQTGWQCKSWTLHGDVDARDDRQNKEDVAAVATWLGQAKTAQIASAGLSVAGRYSVVACKQ